MKWNSNYFYGQKLTDYELQRGYVSYATMAKCFNHVLCNEIANVCYEDLNMVSGFVDNSVLIDKLLDDIYNYHDAISELDADTEYEQICELKRLIEYAEEDIEELRYEEEMLDPEIFQYYIVDDSAVEILQLNNEIVYYIEQLDIYVWGVTHCGTSWDYVLTNIQIELR